MTLSTIAGAELFETKIPPPLWSAMLLLIVFECSSGCELFEMRMPLTTDAIPTAVGTSWISRKALAPVEAPSEIDATGDVAAQPDVFAGYGDIFFIGTVIDLRRVAILGRVDRGLDHGVEAACTDVEGGWQRSSGLYAEGQKAGGQYDCEQAQSNGPVGPM